MPLVTMTDCHGPDTYDYVYGHGDHAIDLIMKREYVGAVLELYERNHYDDSDFCALVWDGECIREVEYASTRGWSYPNHAKVDATDEVKNAAFEWCVEMQYRRAQAAEARKALKIEVGKEVRVVKGRKAPIGTVGYIIDQYENAYDRLNPKFRIETADGTRYTTYHDNLEVVDPQDYIGDIGELLKLSVRLWLGNVNWRSRYEGGY